MKKQPIIALGLLLLIPFVWRLEGWLFSLIDPNAPRFIRIMCATSTFSAR